MDPVNIRLVFGNRLESGHLLSQFCLGTDQVYLCQELIGVENLLNMRTYLIGEDRQDTDNLTPFCCFQFTDLIICLYHFGWLDEYCLSCCTLVMDDTFDTPFQSWCHRNDQSAVTHGRSDILIHQPITLGSMQNSI